MTSQLDIVNRACDALREQPLQSLNDDTPIATAIQRAWKATVEGELRRAVLPFSLKRTGMQRDGTYTERERGLNKNYMYRYLLPADCLMVRKLLCRYEPDGGLGFLSASNDGVQRNASGEVVAITIYDSFYGQRGGYGIGDRPPYEVFGGKVLCDYKQVGLEYTFQPPVREWPEEFADVLALCLASRVSYISTASSFDGTALDTKLVVARDLLVKAQKNQNVAPAWDSSMSAWGMRRRGGGRGR